MTRNARYNGKIQNDRRLDREDVVMTYWTSFTVSCQDLAKITSNNFPIDRRMSNINLLQHLCFLKKRTRDVIRAGLEFIIALMNNGRRMTFDINLVKPLNSWAFRHL